jgi:uncharacterized protein (TIGR03086 family)
VARRPKTARDTVAALIRAGRDREAAIVGAARHRNRGKDRTMQPLEQLGQLGPLLAGVIGNISAEQLDRPTPCADFTVRGVLEHMIGGATQFAAAFQGVPPTDPPTGDLLSVLGPALSHLAAAMSMPGALDRTLATPFGDMTGDVFARYVVLDGLVHGWDLATATGQPYQPPTQLVAAADDFAHTIVDRVRDGRAFGAAVEPSADATPIERLAAFTGRHPFGGDRS